MNVKRIIGFAVLWSVILVPVIYMDIGDEIHFAGRAEGLFMILAPFIFGSIFGFLSEIAVWLALKIKGQYHLFSLNSVHKEKQILDTLKADGLIDESEYKTRLEKLKSRL